jgi:hypothetical protein
MGKGVVTMMKASDTADESHPCDDTALSNMDSSDDGVPKEDRFDLDGVCMFLADAASTADLGEDLPGVGEELFEESHEAGMGSPLTGRSMRSVWSNLPHDPELDGLSDFGRFSQRLPLMSDRSVEPCTARSASQHLTASMLLVGDHREMRRRAMETLEAHAEALALAQEDERREREKERKSKIASARARAASSHRRPRASAAPSPKKKGGRAKVRKRRRVKRSSPKAMARKKKQRERWLLRREEEKRKDEQRELERRREEEDIHTLSGMLLFSDLARDEAGMKVLRADIDRIISRRAEPFSK